MLGVRPERGHNVIEILPTIAVWLGYGLASMVLTLVAIIAVGVIIYPFYTLFERIRHKLL